MMFNLILLYRKRLYLFATKESTCLLGEFIIDNNQGLL